METFTLRCPSVTYAQKGQKILEAGGYRSRLTRIGTGGCAYGLEISASDPERVLRLLEENGVLFVPLSPTNRL